MGEGELYSGGDVFLFFFPVDDRESARCEAELIQDLFSADIV